MLVYHRFKRDLISDQFMGKIYKSLEKTIFILIGFSHYLFLLLFHDSCTGFDLVRKKIEKILQSPVNVSKRIYDRCQIDRASSCQESYSIGAIQLFSFKGHLSWLRWHLIKTNTFTDHAYWLNLVTVTYNHDSRKIPI